MFLRRTLLIAILTSGLWPLAAAAHEYKQGDLLIGHPWARATAGSAGSGAAYFSVANGGAENDRLVATSTDAGIAGKAQLHAHVMENDIMKMRPVDGIDIAAGQTVTLQPGNLHVMLTGLKAPLKEGDTFPLTLTFQKAGTVTVEIYVESVSSNGPASQMPEHSHNHQDHGEK